MNQIQVIGTHNSYHVEPDELMLDIASSFTEEANSMRYSHDPLDVQLDQGVRSFELDIHPYLDEFAVYHIPILDEGSHCPKIEDCLRLVLDWSLQHPDHIPISFLLEFKITESLLSGRELLKADAATLALFEKTILAVMPKTKILSPDDVRGNAATLTAAVQSEGWPLLSDCRGKFFFVLHNRTELREAYTKEHPSLEGRLMFVNSTPDRSDAAFAVPDNPYSQRVKKYIAQGMIVRVRADAGLKEAGAGDTSRRDAAFASGAQIISTDFPRGKCHPETGYCVSFPDDQDYRVSPTRFTPDLQPTK
ncbi:MAG: hypothetical protein GX117_02315 [Candidatus Hydrogenedentes bacterium]|nr:hypothetical protein [Candidatus Hydrogenedentota bacterium]